MKEKLIIIGAIIISISMFYLGLLLLFGALMNLSIQNILNVAMGG